MNECQGISNPTWNMQTAAAPRRPPFGDAGERITTCNLVNKSRLVHLSRGAFHDLLQKHPRTTKWASFNGQLAELNPIPTHQSVET